MYQVIIISNATIKKFIFLLEVINFKSIIFHKTSLILIKKLQDKLFNIINILTYIKLIEKNHK